MPDRSAPIVVTPRACPFVALDGDRDRRLDAPDPLHRCFADPVPRARSIGHQAEYCLSPAFAGCPIFQDWASRAAAEPLMPRVPTTTAPTAVVPTVTASLATSATPAPAAPTTDTSVEAMRLRTEALLVTRPYVPQPDEELTSSRPVPAYRASSSTGSIPATGAAVPVAPDATSPGPMDRPVAGAPLPALDAGSGDDVPVIRSIPAPARPPLPPDDEDWMAPPPWLRQPTGPVWVAEAVPPPDALADVGTQGLRRPRPDDALPAVLAEAAVPIGAEPAYPPPSPFLDETTGAPPMGPDAAPAAVAPSAKGASLTTPGEPGADGMGGSSGVTDMGTSAEVAASRYRSELLAGLEVDDDDPEDVDGRPASRQRRVPIDVHASASLGSQARPSSRSTGSREWEGPRRFEAYAATQRRRLPLGILVGGGAAVLAVLLVGVFLLPGMLMGGAPAATTTPAPTTEVAAVTATLTPVDRTTAPDRTERPEQTPKPKSYRVRSGDTLIKIAKRYNTTVARIQCLNGIKNANNVAVGRVLSIPPKGYRCPRG